MSDDDLFLQEMGDVTPIVQDKADIGNKADSSVNHDVRREAAVSHKVDDNYLSSTTIKWVAPYDIISFKRPGIQDGVFRKLRLGRYLSDARLDLHRMTIDQARKALFDFINECVEYDLRTVMLLHGKGDRDPDRKAILKSHSVHWLEEIPEVMAFHSAQKHHGGTGALYILLRKSDKAKNHNRELHRIRS